MYGFLNVTGKVLFSPLLFFLTMTTSDHSTDTAGIYFWNPRREFYYSLDQKATNVLCGELHLTFVCVFVVAELGEFSASNFV